MTDTAITTLRDALDQYQSLFLASRNLAQEIPLIETSELAFPAFELSMQFGCSYYDAIYLEIARRYSLPFIHADGNLRRVLNGRFPLERWIEDYCKISVKI